MTTPSALHSKKTFKWGTPRWVIQISKILLDNQIHLDPASSPEFNQLVQALVFYTEQDNGLIQEWGGNVFLNPPGGLVNEFWQKLVTNIRSGQVEKAIWVGFSVEQLCTLADFTEYPLDYSTVILRKRLTSNTEDLTIGSSPSHGNYITGLNVDKDLFKKLFDRFGRVIHGVLALRNSKNQV